MNRLSALAALLVVLVLSLARAQSVTSTKLEYAPAPPDNPLKGFAPYARAARDFPHSLEFSYLPLRDLMTGPDQFNWQPLDRLIDDISSRGCQTIFRVYVEYPGKPTAAPQFLLDAGLKLNDYQDKKNRENHTPDYNSPKLRAAMVACIHALGQRYDGDPRIASITAGFLGYWGEWHTSERRELFASQEVQREVMDAYEASFKKTPILLRYPAGEVNSRSMAANASRPFGYHDDSFAFITIPTTQPTDTRYFLGLMRTAGPEAVNKWRTFPIGGETRPEVWPALWSDPSDTPAGQEFLRCVEETHVTWLMDSSISRKLDAQQRERAIAGERRMGYEFYVQSAELKLNKDTHQANLMLNVKNTGVAPFYGDWPIEMALIDAKAEIVQTWKPEWKLSGMMPDDPPRKLETSFTLDKPMAVGMRLAIRVPNPMAGGHPLRFANATQDAHVPSWLTVCDVP